MIGPNERQYAAGASPEEKRAESVKDGAGDWPRYGGYGMRECDDESHLDYTDCD